MWECIVFLLTWMRERVCLCSVCVCVWGSFLGRVSLLNRGWD